MRLLLIIIFTVVETLVVMFVPCKYYGFKRLKHKLLG